MAVSANFETELARRAGHASGDAATIINGISAAMVNLITAIDADLPSDVAERSTPLMESRLYDMLGEIASEFRDYVE